MSESEDYPQNLDILEHVSFIDEQRKRVLEEDNSGQADFLNLLEHLDPRSTVIEDTRGLHGEIDCSVLEKCDFSNVTALVFSPAKITSIRNIPKGITKLVCKDNYLVEIPELPDSLVELDLQKNAIHSVGKLPEGLKELTLSDNHITSLEGLPESLEVLRLENNLMKTLKLNNMKKLRILICSHNPGLIIENLPDTLEDFQSDNDVITEIQKLRGDSSHGIEKQANYQESLHEYFQLKKIYEENIRKMKREIFRSSKTKKESKMKMATLKPKCMYCERPVGSIFENKGRTFIARCGDKGHPCAFHIELFGGEYSEVADTAEGYQRTIEFTKQEIIIQKLDVLFHYISEADGVDLFKDNLDYYTKENVHFKALKKEYDSLYFDEELEEKLVQKRKRISDIQDRLRELMKEYDIHGESEIIKDVMTVYIRELMPEIQNEAFLKFKTREMEWNQKRERFELFQKGWRPNQLEYTFGEYPRVVHFHVK
jgi:hypothetical protein